MELFEVESRVAAGAAWMDINAPEGWMDKVALATLDVCNPFRCVLGQVFERPGSDIAGYYYAMYNLMPGGRAQAAALGFDSSAYFPDVRRGDLNLLTEAWKRYITVKREELALAA